MAEQALTAGDPEVRRHAAWFLAVHAAAGGNRVTARAHLHALVDDREGSLLPSLMVDPSDHAHLVRIALGAGDEALARRAVDAADALVRANPGVRSLAGSAAHARGLLERDLTALTAAVELLGGGARAMAHASALEDQGRELARSGDEPGAVDALGNALRIHTRNGSLWDASRVRRRLRELGVRRRIVRAVRPATGWAGITDAESAVVRGVAQGLTNREVADQLYLSPHTVSMHLRHVFTKLGINSRVELARLAFQQESAA
jgi:DNA-binding CsgD family transcriptional regulator